MLGIINAKIISKGRFGRMREIALGLPSNILARVHGITTTELGLGDKTALTELAAQERLGVFESAPQDQ